MKKIVLISEEDLLVLQAAKEDLGVNFEVKGTEEPDETDIFDVVNIRNYFATKMWKREDIARLLRANGVPETTQNIDRVIVQVTGRLEDCSEDNELIDSTIECMDFSPKGDFSLSDYVTDEEEIVSYTVEGTYLEYNCIRKKGSTDFGAALESTLHLILENGTEKDVIWIMGAAQDIHIYDEHCTDIDLGWFLPGPVRLL